MEKIGFVGVGNMGEPIALNFLSKGFKLTVYDIQPEKMERLIRAGADPAPTLREVGKGCQIICTSLPTPEIVKAVYLGDDGLLSGSEPGSILIDFSTNDPFTAAEIWEKAKEKELEVLEAPVSGGVDQARAGSLTIFLGGDESAFQKVHSVLEIVGKKIYYVGKLGNASVIKLLNQMLLGINALAAVEAVVLGEKAGVNLQMLYEVILQSSGSSYVWEKKIPNFVLPRNFVPGFPMKLLYKDLKLATDYARRTGGFDLLCGVAERVYRAGISMGFGEEDYCSVVNLIEKMCSLETQ